MFVHLHSRSWYSFLRGGSSPTALAAAAAAAGYKTLALTDVNGVYGSVEHHQACTAHGVRPIIGAEVTVEGGALVLLASSSAGYRHLNSLLTAAHAGDRLHPSASLEDLARHSGDLFCLTGTSEGQLWSLLDAGQVRDAEAWVGTLASVFDERLSIELAHPVTPGARQRMERLRRVSARTGVPTVATGDVRHATQADYGRLDLLTCIRLGIDVFTPHKERPRNAERYLVPPEIIQRRIRDRGALLRAEEIAEACHVDLLPGLITPPSAELPPGVSPRVHLRLLCQSGLRDRYGADIPARARTQLAKELEIIGDLELEEFFLVVHEVVEEARRRQIRCAGRGSAANSLVAYLLGITHVDPLKHRLLFERFLHAGRKGTPDIDVDFDTERRSEIIEWMERRFGHDHTAMAATVITYRLRSALRDSAKALGWSMEDVNKASKAVSPQSAKHALDSRPSVVNVLGDGPLVDALLEAAESLDGCPRHLGLHAGGMVLSRAPLDTFTPVQRSANGVTMVQFDKDDIEQLGAVKLDVLGLRMLAVLSESAELVARHHRRKLDLQRLPLDDIQTFNLIRSGRTLGCFQIESQGQLHLLGQHQPETFQDIIAEVSLFRPGPLQGNMVNPYVRRRRGLERVTFEHPLLESVLSDTYGVILFQEQILEVAHQVAGMSLEESDQFRRLMSKFRSPTEMESMRDRFVDGARARGVPEPVGNSIFDKVSKFVGYGFCRSHAAAFAQTVYVSCWLKAHYPAAYMAAVMQHRPGMYSLTTLQQDARQMGVETLPPDLIQSGVRYDLEHDGDRWVIRMPFSSLTGYTADDAAALSFERMQCPFSSLRDLYERWPLSLAKLRTLAQSGALDRLCGDGRRALWEVGVLEQRLGEPGQGRPVEFFYPPVVHEEDLPELAALSLADRLSWDYTTHHAAREHPMGLARRSLDDLEIRSIALAGRLGRATGRLPLVVTAGIVILRQRPPTANGVLFVTLEDETGSVQCIVRREDVERLDHVFRTSAVVVRGRVHVTGNWHGLVVVDAWPLSGVFGGYEGHPSYAGGMDHHVTEAATRLPAPSSAEGPADSRPQPA